MDVYRPGLRFLRRRAPLTLVCALVCSHAAAVAPYLSIYGGPTTDSNGSQLRGSEVSSNIQHWVNDAGIAVGHGSRLSPAGFVVDNRSTRWNATGTANADLSIIGADSQGRSSTFVAAINDAGIAVGEAEKYGLTGNVLGTRAVRWDGSGVPTELGNLGISSTGYTEASANAVNATGIAVGSAIPLHSSGDYVSGIAAVRWDASGTAATRLDDLGRNSSDDAFAVAYDINITGTVVGYSVRFDSAGNNLGQRPVRWSAGSTTATELPGLGFSLTGAGGGLASSINDVGTAVGYAAKFSPAGNYLGTRAVRWNALGTVTELASLSFNLQGVADVQAIAINESGTTVGFGLNYTNTGQPSGYTAIRWDAAGTAASNLGSASDAFVRGINDSGVAVGRLNSRAVYWAAGSNAPVYIDTLIDPAAGWRLTEAVSISNTGWIVGSGMFDPDGGGPQNQFARYFLVQLPTAVPEPSAVLLIVSAFVAMIRICGRSRGPENHPSFINDLIDQSKRHADVTNVDGARQ